MKKYFLCSVLTLVLCMGVFISCSKDDEGNDYNGYGYLEVSVNGKSYKSNDLLGIAGVGSKISNRDLRNINTPDADIYFYLTYYTNQKYFKDVKTGEYKIGDGFDERDGDIFYLNVDPDISSEDGWYNYVSGGKHTVNNIKLNEYPFMYL